MSRTGEAQNKTSKALFNLIVCCVETFSSCPAENRAADKNLAGARGACLLVLKASNPSSINKHQAQQPVTQEESHSMASAGQSSTETATTYTSLRQG